MRRSWHSRLFAAFCSLWLFVALGEPPMVHACPVHSPGHAGHAMAMGDMASHASMESADGDHAPAQHQGPKACTCLGDCSSVVPTALPAPRIVSTSVATVRIPTPGRPDYEYVAAWVAFVLPFATAPPATV